MSRTQRVGRIEFVKFWVRDDVCDVACLLLFCMKRHAVWHSVYCSPLCSYAVGWTTNRRTDCRYMYSTDFNTIYMYSSHSCTLISDNSGTDVRFRNSPDNAVGAYFCDVTMRACVCVVTEFKEGFMLFDVTACCGACVSSQSSRRRSCCLTRTARAASRPPTSPPSCARSARIPPRPRWKRRYEKSTETATVSDVTVYALIDINIVTSPCQLVCRKQMTCSPQRTCMVATVTLGGFADKVLCLQTTSHVCR